MMTHINDRDIWQVRGALDEMAASEFHHPEDMIYRDYGIGEGSGFPAAMVGGPDFFAFEPIPQN